MARSPLSRALTLSALALLASATTAAADESDYLKNIKALTSEGVKSGESYFSPDGKRIIFQSIRAGCPHYQIYVMNADGSGQRMISTGKGKTTCAFFHPTDPNLFIYASSHLDEKSWPPAPKKRGYSWDFEKSMDIFLADIRDGRIIKRLTTTDGYDAECAFSPDGKKICFMSARDEPAGEIYVMNADGSDPRRLTHAKGYDGGPFFSPDGKKVVFRGFRAPDGRSATVFTIGADGKNEKAWTRLPRVNWCPIYHPSGDYIIYSANVGGNRNFELFLVKTDGSGEVQLTDQPGFDGLPCFSPDGKTLIWTSTRTGGESQIHSADFTLPPSSAFKPQPATAPASSHGEGGHGASEKKDESKHGAASRPSSQPTSKPTSKPTAKAKSGGKLAMVYGAEKGDAAARSAPGGALIRPDALIMDVKVLASDAFEGRGAGTAGGRKARGYLTERFRQIGLEPGGPDGSWTAPFEFSGGNRLAKSGNGLVIHTGLRRVLKLGDDWQPLLCSASDVTGRVPLAFCGYGISAPEKGYDDFAGLDLNGKLALIMTRGPRAKMGGAFEADRPGPHEDLRRKIRKAEKAGAAGVLLIRSSGRGWLKINGAFTRIPVAQLERGVAYQMLLSLGIELEQERVAIDLDLKPRSRVLESIGGGLSVSLDRPKRSGANVVAILKGSDPSLRREYIVIGAHYDHLGYGGSGSLAGVRAIHNGADDNASGTAGLLALAEALKVERPKRSILFMAFDAEEHGLIGSARWLKSPSVPVDSIAAMINMDMIGRLNHSGSVVVGGIGSASGFRDMVSARVLESGLNVALDPDGYGPSDYSSFYSAGVPVLNFFTQTHPDYHKPSDDWDKIDADGMAKVLRLVNLLARDLAGAPDRPQYLKIKRPERKDPRAVQTGEALPYFGSIPDYAQDKSLKGVLLSGARAGSPADKAGLKRGDIVVEFAGKKIGDIYDYTYAIQGCSAGQTVDVSFVRAGERRTVKVELGAR